MDVGEDHETKRFRRAPHVALLARASRRSIGASLADSRNGSPEGARYAVTDGTIEESRVALETLLPQLFLRVDAVSEMIVLRTVPGGAQPIAAALDGEAWPDVLGTIGGDDTILIVCRSGLARDRVVRRLKALAGEP